MLELNKEYIAFEKRHGSRKGIEEAIVNRRREVCMYKGVRVCMYV